MLWQVTYPPWFRLSYVLYFVDETTARLLKTINFIYL